MQQAQQIVIPEGWVRNAIGNLVHETEIREQDKLRDGVVTEIAKKAVELNASLKALKDKALADIADLISIAGEKYDMKLGGPKGNVTLTSFDGRFRLQRVCADRITYTEEMEVARYSSAFAPGAMFRISTWSPSLPMLFASTARVKSASRALPN